MEPSFDMVFENPLQRTGLPPRSLGDILFDKLPHRPENSNVILSHYGNAFIALSLDRIRHIVIRLNSLFDVFHIERGQTVIILTFQGCNEMITALFFLALASRGCRTFMPMYSEQEEFSGWIPMTGSRHLLVPGEEVLSLDGHEREKSGIREILGTASAMNISAWDTQRDFGIGELMEEPMPQDDLHNFSAASKPSDDVLIVTTSGSSGRSKLVVYTHEAYFYNCLAWEQAGFYKKELLGGRGFTPLLTHTMGIRALINALWTGSPVCLIITEWFISKPETVRYFLLKMMPEHITGGPAVYNYFLEMFRIYPEIKLQLGSNLKTLVSSGAAYDASAAGEVLNATGLRLHNAFGTTETQQVFSTLLCHDSVFGGNLVPLGRPLPGVSIGLARETGTTDQFRLHVKSAFGHSYCIGTESGDSSGYFDTGDIISIDEQKNFFYVRRSALDYFKDSFGVKIPALRVREYYRDLVKKTLHCEFYPLLNYPGLTLLLFIRSDSLPPGPVVDAAVLKKFIGTVDEINNRLISTIEPFEFQHRHICRIALVNSSPPRTGKGTISLKQINTEYHDLIERLRDIRRESEGIESTDAMGYSSSGYSKYMSPQIGTMLTALRMNCQYERGTGDFLYTYINGKEVEVLDAAGGYGTNFLGHNNSKVADTLKSFLGKNRIAISNQLSIQNSSALLAEKLNFLIGRRTGRSYMVIFGNSGSEAVEIAIHHAYFEWERRIDKIRDQQLQVFGNLKDTDTGGIWKNNIEILAGSRPRIIAVEGSFHGQTAGARSILGHRKNRTKFASLTNIVPVFIDDRDEDWHEVLAEAIRESEVSLRRVIQDGHEIKVVPFNVSTLIAAFAEPVMGEGGVRVVNKDFMEQLSKHDFPLISDEIQCGLGRTGEIPECKTAHYYLFGKALGGGFEKISAVMIDKSRFCFSFSEYFTSTFGNGELAAAAAMKTIGVIEADALAQKAHAAGELMKTKLLEIRERYPDIISEITGKGLMMAVAFSRQCTRGNLIMRVLFEKEKAGYLFSAWMLNRHRIRIFPTLSAPDSLRLEPSAYISENEISRICSAFLDLCSILREKRMYELFSFLMDDDPFHDESVSSQPQDFYAQDLEIPAKGSVKTALIAHFAFPLRELRMLVPDFARASDTGLRILFNRFQALMEHDPVKMLAMNLFGGKIHFSFWVLPMDSAEMEFLHKSGRRKRIVAKIQKAVDIAASEGAEVISLGGYNSIITNNGLSLADPRGTRVITGNTLTAAVNLAHLGDTIRCDERFNKPNIIAVIGSTGNIGRVTTEIISQQPDICSELILVSRSEKRQTALLNELKGKKNSTVVLRSTGNMHDIREADILIICSNTNDPIIFPHHVAAGKPVLITDISVPSAVSPDVYVMKNVIGIPFSSYVTLPRDKEKVISSYSPRGTVFCCAAESILLGLGSFPGKLKGRILPEEVRMMTRLAEKHGFLSNIGNSGSFKSR